MSSALARTLSRHRQRAHVRKPAIGRAELRGVPGAPQARQGRPGGPTAYVSPPPVHFPSDPNAIVTVNVRTILAPTPNTYQQTGALVSFGGSTLNDGECQELTQRGDLGLIVPDPANIVTLSWAAGVVTATLPTDTILFPSGDPGSLFEVVINDCWPDAYNGVHMATVVDSGSVTGTPQFSYPLAADPGAPSALGTVQTSAAAELGQMATTFFDQGNAISVYVLELGPELSMMGKRDALQEWLNSNPRSFYGYLMPRSASGTVANYQIWDPLLKQFQNPESMTYFWFTVTPETMRVYVDSMNMSAYKCLIQMVEAPAVTDPAGDNITDPYGEFSLAAMFYNAMIYRPSSALRISPMAFKFAYGVTAYPTQNNGPLLVSFKDTHTNYISTGAEGGIAFNMIYTGVTLDGMDYFNWWWTIDWVQIQANIDVSNAVINGSNNPFAPLYYDQSGIDVLQTALLGTMASAKAFGMVVGALVATSLTGDQLQTNIDSGTYEGLCNINAVPFIPYAEANPGDYKIGEYDGLSVLFIPKRGFIHILITIAASELVVV